MRFSLEALCLLVCILLCVCSAEKLRNKHKGNDKGKTNAYSESNITDMDQLEAKHFGSFGLPPLEELVGAGQRTLLLTVASGSRASQSCVITNMVALKEIADVGVLVLGAPSAPELASQWAGVAEAARTAGVVLRMRASPLPYERSTFVTKLYYQVRARDWISLYDYVWLADSDILFHQFDYAQFWLSHQNSFLHGPPLLAQPLIRQNTQLLIYGFNMDQWSKALGANYTQYVATNVYVEQQAPFFKAKFLVWLLDRLGPLLDKQLAMDNDWGAGGLWCGAAAHYIKNSDDQNQTSCGIVLVPIDHADSKTIAQGPEFIKAGYALLKYIKNSNDPEWSKWGESLKLKVGRGVVFGPPNHSKEHFTPMRWTVSDGGDIKLSLLPQNNSAKLS
mmetsp:Transcript_26147/g.56515  ORF Transcript_26147/g.56515 Transcript_26147/m.56515 type:complete len:391 (-) Transcript_26147:115-1287(-)